MYEVSKEFRFEAAHRLPDHDGKCSSQHGHGYLVRVICRGPRLDTTGSSTGMLIDYAELASVVAPVIAKLDHHDLNEVIPVLYHPTTAENLARWIHDQLLHGFLEKPGRAGFIGAGLVVEVQETAGTMVRYTPGWRDR